MLSLLAVGRLDRNQIAWSLYRTTAWLGGLLVVMIATGSGLAR